MKYKIAVCDDQTPHRELLCRLVSSWAEKNGALTELRSYCAAAPFLFDYEQEKDFDLLLLDIEMPGVSGVELAKTVRKDNSAVQIVFVTGYDDYFSDGFDVSALHYLLKPINYQDGKAALQKARNKLEGRPHPYDDPQHIINRIRDYIRKNYQKRLSLDDIADEFFINRTYLSELFRERLGKNFVQYKNEVRIEQAKILLKDTQLPVSQIAAQCGFDNTSYFALVFRQITGLSPGQFRK